ncbi:hypothetical protein CCHL11_00213 [Colletotrichum chlorophyti]|uniref:C2H2-type domain-containing protein n=1 Tax=Colletotrichum chlorophyti TaxID=708187 RepID=A0A1Q8RUL6_9PEZI|nr:hypothetical protein CCHL11_00213 [Colletotrichum chlorophyti]
MASPMVQQQPLPNGAGYPVLTHTDVHDVGSQPGSARHSTAHHSTSASPAPSANHPNSIGTGHTGTGTQSPSVVSSSNQQGPSTPKQMPVPLPVPVPGDQRVATDVTEEPAENPEDSSLYSPICGVKTAVKWIKFEEDYQKMCALFRDADADAVRRAVRDNHAVCLLGSHYHTAFVMNVTMHKADGSILRRAFQDFGSRIIAETKHDIVDQLTTSDLDQLADRILSKASSSFLDKALVARLPTIEARRLVNALARAERLGYDAGDIIENEHVIPSVPGIATPQTYSGSQAAPNFTPGVGGQSVATPDHPSHPRCQSCQRTFPAVSAYNYHLKKHVCTKPVVRGLGGETFICPHCSMSFTGAAGLQYHMLKKVCGDFGEVDKNNITATPATARLNPPTKRPAPVSSHNDTTPTRSPRRTSNFWTVVDINGTACLVDGNGQPVPRTLPLGFPQPKDMKHLTTQQVEALRGELEFAEEQFRRKIEAQKAEGQSEEVLRKLTTLRNSYACKQSTIRKRFGIKLRQRRGREEMESERIRLGIPDGVSRQTPTSDQHADKRARLGDEGHAAAAQAYQETPTKRVAVADMGNGLTGSNATAATEDPTRHMTQAPSLSQSDADRQPSSSYQQGNYRIQVHEPSPSKQIASSAPNEAPNDGTPSQTPGDTSTSNDMPRRIGERTAADDSDSESEPESSTDDGV